MISAWRGLHLLDPGVCNEQVGLVGAAGLAGTLEGLERGVHAHHLGHRMDNDAPCGRIDFEALVGQPVGEVHLREGVRQHRVRAAAARQAGSVVVATYDHERDAVVTDRRQRSLGDAERTVVRSGVVEDVA